MTRELTGKDLLKAFLKLLVVGAILAGLAHWHGYRWGIWQ